VALSRPLNSAQDCSTVSYMKKDGAIVCYCYQLNMWVMDDGQCVVLGHCISGLVAHGSLLMTQCLL